MPIVRTCRLMIFIYTYMYLQAVTRPSVPLAQRPSSSSRHGGDHDGASGSAPSDTLQGQSCAVEQLWYAEQWLNQQEEPPNKDVVIEPGVFGGASGVAWIGADDMRHVLQGAEIGTVVISSYMK